MAPWAGLGSCSHTSQQGSSMIPVTLLHTPFDRMLLYGVALIGLAVVQQAGNLGRLSPAPSRVFPTRPPIPCEPFIENADKCTP